jgi:hypothetical protein
MSGALKSDDREEVSTIMRVLDPSLGGVYRVLVGGAD